MLCRLVSPRVTVGLEHGRGHWLSGCAVILYRWLLALIYERAAVMDPVHTVTRELISMPLAQQQLAGFDKSEVYFTPPGSEYVPVSFRATSSVPPSSPPVKAPPPVLVSP